LGGEEPVTETDEVDRGVRRALLDIKEKYAKKKKSRPDKEALRLLVKDLSDKFDISMRSTSAVEGHTPMVESHKLLTEDTADPSAATDSMTRSGQCSVQDDLDHERGESATALAKKMADEMADEAKDFYSHIRRWESAWSETCGPFDFTSEYASPSSIHNLEFGIYFSA
jgi:hypothetical protein